MASLLETLRSTILTSIRGRRFGLTNDDYLAGAKALQSQVEDIQTTAPTSASQYGITRVLTSGSTQGPSQHTLPAPKPGVEKIIALQSTSTGSQQFSSTAAGASIISASDGTTKSCVNLLGPGGLVRLIGVTTDRWLAMVAGSSGFANVSFTTST
jgi:hypothetical protein